MTRFLIVSIKHSEDVALGRYAILAAHSTPGLAVVLDLTRAGGDVGVDRRLVDELHATTRGNEQWLALVAPPGAPVSDELPRAEPSTGLSRHESLGECLRSLGPDPLGGCEVHLTLPARIEYLAPVREYLAGLVRTVHGEEDAFPVEILVDEACLNAVENSPSDRNSYDVDFRCEGAELVLDVVNVFDDTLDSARIMHRRLASFDDSGDYLGERGRGLFLIARIADGLQIRPEGEERIRVTVTRGLGPRRRGQAPR